MAKTQTPPLIYDTHEAVRRLTDAGMSEPQAEAVVREQVRLLEQNLATRTDLELVRADVASVRAEVEKLRLETKAEIEKVKSTLIAWMVGLNVTMAGLVIAVVSLL